MKITIEIVDRNYEQIKEFCDFNKITIDEYIVNCVENDFFIRKYGDLNEKVSPTEKKTEIIKEETKVEKKKPGRPKKKIEEPKIEIEKNEKEINNTNDFIKEKQTDTTDKELQKLQQRIIRRTLKTN